jgi:hypothetical protein
VSSDTTNLVLTAYAIGNPAVRRVLGEKGIELKDAAQLGTPFIALNVQDSAYVGTLLDAGADPKQSVQVEGDGLPSEDAARGRHVVRALACLRVPAVFRCWLSARQSISSFRPPRRHGRLWR